jgi:hypothetical protein
MDFPRPPFDNSTMSTIHSRILTAMLSLLILAATTGCYSYFPDYQKKIAELSDENYTLTRKVDSLQKTIGDKDATIAHQQELLASNLPRIETLPAARLAELFTTGHIEIRPATDAADFDSNGTQDGFHVLVRTTTADGAVLPASGTLIVEAFDLAVESGDNRLGRWVFSPETMKKSWYDGFGLYQFAFNCPWTKHPDHSAITFKVKFVEALTGSVFVDQQTLNVHLTAVPPPTTTTTAPK